VLHAQEGRTAVVDYTLSPSGEGKFTYAQLLDDVAKFRDELASFLGRRDLKGERVAFLVESGYNYVVTLFTIWALGGFAVPLCTTHPVHEMLYTVTDSDSVVLLASHHFEGKIRELADEVAKVSDEKRVLFVIPHRAPCIVNTIPQLEESPIAAPMRHALMIYTSGTTGKPKVRYCCGVRSNRRALFPHTKQLKRKSCRLSNSGKSHQMTE